MIDAQLNNLIQAMAGFVSSNPSFNLQATVVTMPTDSHLEVTITASWHS